MDTEPIIIVENDLEEGELLDEDIEYTPLQRPETLHRESLRSSTTHYQSDDDLESDVSESDSDSDSAVCRVKRSKIRRKNRKTDVNHKSKNNYNIWCSKAQEDALTETLISCDVTKVDRSRDVETYNYPARRFQNERPGSRTSNSTDDNTNTNERTTNKRKNSDRSNVKLRLGKRNNDDDDKKGYSRNILDLTVTVNNTEDEVATDIANKLCEDKDDLLKRIVAVAGKERAIALFKETKRIEEDGGMLIMNQTRRRTPGGVYFFLIKRDDVITEDQKREIFADDKRSANKIRKEKIRKKIEQQMKNNLTINGLAKLFNMCDACCPKDYTSFGQQASHMLKSLASPEDENKFFETMAIILHNLPSLLTRAELCAQEIAKGNRTRKENEDTEHNVSNPPPSPVTDCKENSSDGTPDVTDARVNTVNNIASDRNINIYEEDYLDIACDDMDLF